MSDKKKAFEDWYATVEGVSALSHLTAPPVPCSLALAGRILRVAFERGYDAAAGAVPVIKCVKCDNPATIWPAKVCRDHDPDMGLSI